MNWERGLKRVWLGLLGFFWFCILCAFAIDVSSQSAFGALGAYGATLVLGSAVWMGLGYCLLWIIRGFTGPPEKPPASR